MTRQLAYCTNVHAGSDLDAMRANLAHHCLAVKQRFAPDQPMGVGLWVAAPAAKKLLQPQRLTEFSEWLAAEQLIPFTLNGFPYGDFHEPVVKHRVYHPTWFDPERVELHARPGGDPACHSPRIDGGEHLDAADRLARATADRPATARCGADTWGKWPSNWLSWKTTRVV